MKLNVRENIVDLKIEIAIIELMMNQQNAMMIAMYMTLTDGKHVKTKAIVTASTKSHVSGKINN